MKVFGGMGRGELYAVGSAFSKAFYSSDLRLTTSLQQLSL